jgi:hypothetical protein
MSQVRAADDCKAIRLRIEEEVRRACNRSRLLPRPGPIGQFTISHRLNPLLAHVAQPYRRRGGLK